MPLFFGALGLGLIGFFPIDHLGFYLVKAVLVCLGLGAGFWFVKKQRVMKVMADDWRRSLVLAYFILVFFYAVFSITPVHSLIEVSVRGWDLISQLVYFGMFVFVVLSFGSGERKRFFEVIAVVNSVAVIYGLMQLVGWDPLAFVWDVDRFLGRIFSVVGNPNWLAGLVVLTLPVVMIVVKNWRWRMLFVVMNLMVLAGTGSKAGVVAMVVMAVAFLVLAKKMAAKKLKRFEKWSLVVLFLGLMVSGFALLNQRYAHEFELGRSTNSRLVIWDGAMEMIAARPIGYGLDSFQLVFPQFVSQELWEYEDVNTTIASAHNVILDLWINVGPVGMMIFLVLMVVLVMGNLRSREEWRKALAIGILGYFVTNLFGFGVFGNEVILWGFIGLLLMPKSKLKLVEGRERFVNVVVAFLFLVLSLVNLIHLQASFWHTQALGYSELGDVQTSYQQSMVAVERFAFDRVLLLEGARAMLATGAVEGVENYLAGVEVMVGDYDLEAKSIGALLLATRGENEAAELRVEELIESAPNVVLGQMTAVDVYRLIGDEEKEKNAVEGLIKLLPSYWNQPKTEGGRIFRKLNPWVEEFDSVE